MQDSRSAPRSGKKRGSVTYQVPNAAAERRKAQLPQWSPGAMASGVAAAPGGRRATCRRRRRVEADGRTGEHDECAGEEAAAGAWAAGGGEGDGEVCRVWLLDRSRAAGGAMASPHPNKQNPFLSLLMCFFLFCAFIPLPPSLSLSSHDELKKSKAAEKMTWTFCSLLTC